MQAAWFHIWGTRSRMPQIRPGTDKQIDKMHNFKKESLKINNVEQDAFVKNKAEDKIAQSYLHPTSVFWSGGLWRMT